MCPLCRGPHRLEQPFCWEGDIDELRKRTRRAWWTYFGAPDEVTWGMYLQSRQSFWRGVRRAKWVSWRLFMESLNYSKAMSDFYRHAQGRENKSINLLNDVPFDGLESLLSHLLDVHFPGHTTLVKERRWCLSQNWAGMITLRCTLHPNFL